MSRAESDEFGISFVKSLVLGTCLLGFEYDIYLHHHAL